MSRQPTVPSAVAAAAIVAPVVSTSSIKTSACPRPLPAARNAPSTFSLRRSHPSLVCVFVSRTLLRTWVSTRHFQRLASAFAIADRLALMHQGRFLIVDRPEVVRACHNPIVRNFLDRKPPEMTDGAEKFRVFLDDLSL